MKNLEAVVELSRHEGFSGLINKKDSKVLFRKALSYVNNFLDNAVELSAEHKILITSFAVNLDILKIDAEQKQLFWKAYSEVARRYKFDSNFY